MKALDPTFKLVAEHNVVIAALQLRINVSRLPEFVELTEHVIAPHLLHSFLHGDREALRIVRDLALPRNAICNV